MINGTDYTLVIIIAISFAVIAAAQYFLCAKTKNKILKLLPCVFGLVFIGLAVAAQFGSSGGFIDLRGFVTFIYAVAAALCFLAQGAGWCIWKIKNR